MVLTTNTYIMNMVSLVYERHNTSRRSLIGIENCNVDETKHCIFANNLQTAPLPLSAVYDQFSKSKFWNRNSKFS